VPAGLDATAAAGLGVAGLSAYIPLVEIAQVKPRQRVLIHAGAGGVGSLAIQIAKHLGAHVTATASSSNREFCISLGAEEAADYQKEDFSMRGPFDVILDTIGGQTHLLSEKALKPGGLLVALAAAPIPDAARRADVRVVMAQIQPTRARLEALLEWASKGVLRPQVTKTLPLREAQEAYAILESGHGRGKLLLIP
jgi:NADPH:quinone reductase-like Zn-dependent oxidoreductase